MMIGANSSGLASYNALMSAGVIACSLTTVTLTLVAFGVKVMAPSSAAKRNTALSFSAYLLTVDGARPWRTIHAVNEATWEGLNPVTSTVPMPWATAWPLARGEHLDGVDRQHLGR